MKNYDLTFSLQNYIWPANSKPIFPLFFLILLHLSRSYTNFFFIFLFPLFMIFQLCSLEWTKILKFAELCVLKKRFLDTNLGRYIYNWGPTRQFSDFHQKLINYMCGVLESMGNISKIRECNAENVWILTKANKCWFLTVLFICTDYFIFLAK